MCVIFTYLQEQKIKIDRDLVGLAQWLACPPLTYGKSCVRVIYMHLKYLLGSFVRVGYRIMVPDFYLVLHGPRCRKSTIMD